MLPMMLVLNTCLYVTIYSDHDFVTITIIIFTAQADAKRKVRKRYSFLVFAWEGRRSNYFSEATPTTAFPQRVCDDRLTLTSLCGAQRANSPPARVPQFHDGNSPYFHSFVSGSKPTRISSDKWHQPFSRPRRNGMLSASRGPSLCMTQR